MSASQERANIDRKGIELTYRGHESWGVRRRNWGKVNKEQREFRVNQSRDYLCSLQVCTWVGVRF